jgi:hypothetical protein
MKHLNALHSSHPGTLSRAWPIALVSEPPYAADTPREILLPELENISAFVCFLFFVLEAN